MPSPDRTERWNSWWRDRLQEDGGELSRRNYFPEDRLYFSWGNIFSDYRYGYRSVLFAGNGTCQCPRDMARAGYKAIGLDVSTVATRLAARFEYQVHHTTIQTGRLVRGWIRSRMEYFDEKILSFPGGSAEFVCGDILDSESCPGPFDVVVSSGVVQYYEGRELQLICEAILSRCSSNGAAIINTSYRRGLASAVEQIVQKLGWSISDESGLLRPGTCYVGKRFD